MAAVARNPEGSELAWEFFRDQFGLFYQRYKESPMLMSRLVAAVTQGFDSTAKYTEIQGFFSAHPIEAATRAIEQSLEVVQSNIDWLATHADEIEAWLQARVDS